MVNENVCLYHVYFFKYSDIIPDLKMIVVEYGRLDLEKLYL